MLLPNVFAWKKAILKQVLVKLISLLCACYILCIFTPALAEIKIKHDQRPTDLEYALMSSYAYNSDLKRGDIFTDLPGWQVYKIKNGRGAYQGVVFTNANTHQFVIAHKGTNLFSFGDLKTDLVSIFGEEISFQESEAFNLIKEVLDDREKNHKDYMVSFTGHSLGAFLAEISVFFCHKDYQYPEASAVTFDSPGSFESMTKLQSNDKNNEIILNELDIISYVGSPNLINNLNHHVGSLYQIENRLGKYSWLPGLFTYTDHAITGFIDYFKKNSTETKSPVYLSDWPCYKSDPSLNLRTDMKIDQRTIVESFSTWDENCNCYHIIINNNDEKFELTYNGHYQDSTYNSTTSMPLRNFGKGMQEFLRDVWKQTEGWDKETKEKMCETLHDQGDIPDELIDCLINFRLEGGYRNIVKLNKLNESIPNIYQFRNKLSEYFHDCPDIAGKIRKNIKDVTNEESTDFWGKDTGKLVSMVFEELREEIVMPNGRRNEATEQILPKNMDKKPKEMNKLELMKAALLAKVYFLRKQKNDNSETRHEIAVLRKDVGITSFLLYGFSGRDKDLIEAKENLLKAELFFKKLLDKSEELSSQNLKQSKIHLAEVLKYLGKVFKQQQTDKANKYSEEALRLYKNELKLSDDTIEVYYDLSGNLFYEQESGLENYEQGGGLKKQIFYTNAVKDIIGSICGELTSQQKSDLAGAYADLGYFSTNLKNETEAEHNFLESIALIKPKPKEPKDYYNIPYVYGGYGMLLYKQQRYLEAKKQFEEISTLLEDGGFVGRIVIPLGESDILLFNNDSLLIDMISGGKTFKFDTRLLAYYYLVKCSHELGEHNSAVENLAKLNAYKEELERKYFTGTDESSLESNLANQMVQASKKLVDNDTGQEKLPLDMGCGEDKPKESQVVEEPSQKAWWRWWEKNN